MKIIYDIETITETKSSKTLKIGVACHCELASKILSPTRKTGSSLHTAAITAEDKKQSKETRVEYMVGLPHYVTRLEVC